MKPTLKALAAAMMTAAVLITSATACTDSRTAQENKIFLSINDRCPLKLDNGTTLEKVEITDGYVVYTILIGMSKADYDAYSPKMRQATMSLLIDKEKITKFEGPDADRLRDFLLRRQYGLRYIVNGRGGNLFEVDIPYSELSALIRQHSLGLEQAAHETAADSTHSTGDRVLR